MYDEIAAVFRVYGRKDVIYSWGERIYNPHDNIISPQLLDHEAVHGRRQTSDESKIRDWWKRYMEDIPFRFEEEIEAHQAEYAWFMTYGTRHQRRAALKQVATRLCGPLYGYLCNPAKARAILRRN